MTSIYCGDGYGYPPAFFPATRTIPSPSTNVAKSGHTLRIGYGLPMRSTLQKKWRTAATVAQAETVVGIDLGTTNSAIAVIEEGRPVIVPDSDGAHTIPSVLHFPPGATPLVGRAAQRKSVASPSCTFYSVKRFIGQKCSTVKDDLKKVAYTVEADDEGWAVCQCPSLPEGQISPEEISAVIISHLLGMAEVHTGCPVTKAVISVPAYFSETQREATISAGKLAGLDVVRLIREPVAAALAYGVDVEEDATILVLDLGGGTFDVSLLEVGGGVIEVLATGGDAHLGGDDWDAAIVQWIISAVLQPASFSWNEPKTLAQLRKTAEAAKIKLSTAEKVAIRTPVTAGDRQGGEVILTRQLFEKLSADLYRRVALAVDQACWQAGVDLEDVAKAAEDKRKKQKGAKGGLPEPELRPKRRPPVSEVLLVGGATRMPGFQRLVKHMTGLQPKGYIVDPDEAVALGAAVQAGLLQGSVPEVMVMDVWQAGLMRALATHKLKSDDAAAKKMLGSVLPEPDDQEDWPDIDPESG